MKAELFIRITWEDSKGKTHEDYYNFERRDPGNAKLVWELRKPDGSTRNVTVHTDGRITCDCQQYILGRKICKHIKALTQAGELPGWKPKAVSSTEGNPNGAILRMGHGDCAMKPITRKALAMLPLTEETVQSFYDGTRSGTAEQCLKALCESHERLRAELKGAEILLDENAKEISDANRLLDDVKIPRDGPFAPLAIADRIVVLKARYQSLPRSLAPDPQETLQEDWEKARDDEQRDQAS